MADKRYIDADKLTFSRVRIIHSDGTIGGWHAVVMSSVIKDAPAADVVEVVRCKDCKHYGFYYGDFKNRACCYAGVTCRCEENHFCGYGERKEQI